PLNCCLRCHPRELSKQHLNQGRSLLAGHPRAAVTSPALCCRPSSRMRHQRTSPEAHCLITALPAEDNGISQTKGQLLNLH
ncbi:hypothetical protein Nmel_015718, partial [Mimus melanotis]